MTRQRKNTQDRKRRVAGEAVDILLPLLLRARTACALGADGTFSGHATYGKEEGPPPVRALMRVEAELLLHDVRHLRGHEDDWRTPEARRADALVLRTASAVGQPTDPALLARYRPGSTCLHLQV